MINVYFERGYASEEVAKFHDQETYMACLSSLKELAKKQRWERVTETVIVMEFIIITCYQLNANGLNKNLVT